MMIVPFRRHLGGLKVRTYAIHMAIAIATLAILGSTAIAGTTAYDLNQLLYQPHPFGTSAPSAGYGAAPLPQSQIRAPARIPPTAAQLQARSAAAPTAGDIRPPVAQSPGPMPQLARSGYNPGGLVSELRGGLLAHDYGPFSRNEEDGVDVNLEVLFVSPNFLRFLWSPRPHLGATINTAGDTSQLYFGLSWEWTFWDSWFAGFSLGGAVHDGKLETNQVDRKELGCRILFRESVEGGYRFNGRHSISLFLDHISNAKLCSRNEGLENVGIRYGYRF